MDALELSFVDLVDRIRDCIAAASIAEETGDEQLRLDAIKELRVMFTEYLRRTEASASPNTLQ
jgi:hypothetical protein